MSRRNSNDGSGVSLTVDSKAFSALLKYAPDVFTRYKTARYRDEDDPVALPLAVFDVSALTLLLKHLRDRGDRSVRWLIGQVEAHLIVMRDPDKEVVKTLPALETAVRAYVLKGALRGWIFCRDEVTSTLEAWLIRSVKYHMPVQYSPAHVELSLARWGMVREKKGGEDTRRITFNYEDLKQQQTVSQLLADVGVYHENRMTLNLYDKAEESFLQWRKQLGEQFVGNGAFNALDKDGWYDRDPFDAHMDSVRLVIDDAAVQIQPRTRNSLLQVIDEENDEENTSAAEEAEAQDKFSLLPCDLRIMCFNMSSYRTGLVHIAHMKPYEYQPDVRSKLILPPAHEDLIDALTADMNVLQEDIVLGKSGGTAILCFGPAGCGKTLTAEVFSEVVKRPLYRVHSGQLGTDAATVEAALTTALDNATRWRAVLLIDEADVFVRKRGNDLEMNAVVGVFLRTLEYYKGLLFLTTNLPDEIDDAILSRCIAQLRYSKPAEEERVKLWQTLGSVYGCELVQQPKVARELAHAWECSGRDIKGLIRLSMKWARQRDKQLEVADIKRLSVFKGL